MIWLFIHWTDGKIVFINVSEYGTEHNVDLEIDLELAVGRSFTFQTDEDQTKNKYRQIEEKLTWHTNMCT